ncbi:MAG: D-tyrosyl-tRNA(Tyr) deacylase [Phycisphaerales bacterium]|jgi:D-aminoacyl-tRNA deacylase|nr:D-tyrosyl-tRNA(Tyr) deacylase [Phycisphaerales bacterium]
MRAVLQRVNHAAVTVDGAVIGACESGLLVYVGVFEGDQVSDAAKLADKIAGLRIFEDQYGKMNNNVRDARGGILAISNFTLAADTRKGRRPSFGLAACPGDAEAMFNAFVEALKDCECSTETGRFGAHMIIDSQANGPVNVILDTRGEA